MIIQSKLALFIKCMHFILIMFIIIIPFTNNESLLTLHAIGLPGLIIHWITNNNVCSLTLLESQLTGESMENTCIGKIMHPFFEINDYTIYAIMIGLWFITLYKLYPTKYRILKLCFAIIWDYIKSCFTSLRNIFI